jgi:hypothetical protein
MILFYNATLFVGFSTVTATLATQFQQIYGYDELTLGLLYLPIGGSTTIASIGGGFIADWNFRRTARKLGVKVDSKRGNDRMYCSLPPTRQTGAKPQTGQTLDVSVCYRSPSR